MIDGDLFEACAQLSAALSDLRQEIARLDGRDVDTHKLRNILQTVQLNATLLIEHATVK